MLPQTRRLYYYFVAESSQQKQAMILILAKELAWTSCYCYHNWGH